MIALKRKEIFKKSVSRYMNIDINKTIVGEFIELIQIDNDDAEMIYNWRIGLSGQFMNQPDGYSVEMQKQWMKSRPNNEINYMIVDKKNRLKVGMVAIVGISIQDKNAEIGRLLLAPEYLNKSNPYGLEALKLCSNQILNVWNFHKICGNVLSENVAMLRLQKYLGMKEEGLLVDQKSIKGKLYNLHLVALFKDDLQKCYLPRISMLLKAFTNG